jgi:hypothetical protein
LDVRVNLDQEEIELGRLDCRSDLTGRTVDVHVDPVVVAFI